MKRYMTRWEEIIEVEIERETVKFVVLVGGSKEIKRSDWQNYWLTWNQAKSYILEKAIKQLERAKEDVKDCEAKISNISRLTQHS